MPAADAAALSDILSSSEAAPQGFLPILPLSSNMPDVDGLRRPNGSLPQFRTRADALDALGPCLASSLASLHHHLAPFG